MKVAEGQRTVEGIAQKECWNPNGTRMLLDVLSGMRQLSLGLNEEINAL